MPQLNFKGRRKGLFYGILIGEINWQEDSLLDFEAEHLESASIRTLNCWMLLRTNRSTLERHEFSLVVLTQESELEVQGGREGLSGQFEDILLEKTRAIHQNQLDEIQSQYLLPKVLFIADRTLHG